MKKSPFQFKESPRPVSTAPEVGKSSPNPSFRASVFEADSSSNAASTVFPEIVGEHLPDATWIIPSQVAKVLDKSKK